MEKIIAGLVQMDSGPDMNENMRMAEQYVREAAEQGAKLILFPETAEYTGADMPGHASAVPGYVSRRFSSLAKSIPSVRLQWQATRRPTMCWDFYTPQSTPSPRRA